MQPSDRAPAGVTTATSVVSSESMLEALKHLYRAFQRCSIYPEGHPSVPLAFDEAQRLLVDALGSQDSVVVTAGRNQLALNGSRLPDSGGTLASLAALLHELDVAGLGFRAGIGRDELVTFVSTLGEARRDGVKGAGLAELIAARLHNLEVTPIDYAALRFREGQRTEDVADRGDLWESLGELLTRTSETSGEVAKPEEIAREVDRDIEEGAGVDEVRDRITRLSRQINEAKPSRRSSGRSWLTRFVAALNPRLRSDLLRIDPNIPDATLAVVNELADVIPEKELFDALQEIDRAGGRLPNQFMTLMNKLMRLSHGRPSLREGIGSPPARASTRPASPDDATGLREALAEVLQRRGAAEFNPQPYQSLLDGLAVQTLAGSDTESTSIYRDPRDREDARLHAAEVAVRLAAQPGGEQHRSGIFDRLAADTERLLAGNRLEELRDAAVSARGYSVHKHADEPTRRAAKAFLQRFKSESSIELIIESARTEGALSDAAKILLELGGVTALGMLLDALDEKLPRAIESDLQTAAAERNSDELRKVLQWRAERGWEALRPVFPVLRLLDPEVASELLEELLGHAEFEVRRDALLTLIAADRPDSLLQPLRRGLGDPDPRLVTLVIRSLADLREEQTVELLGGYVEGGLDSIEPTLDCATLAARCLAQKGDCGIQRLGQCLERLSGSYRPLKVRLAFRVRDELQPHIASDGISERLRSWRFSPAGLVGWLTPGKRARGAGHG